MSSTAKTPAETQVDTSVSPPHKKQRTVGYGDTNQTQPGANNSNNSLVLDSSSASNIVRK